MNLDTNLIYYESKLQYWIVAFISFLGLLIVTIINLGNLANVTIYLVLINLVALIFLFFYKTSSFELTKDNLIWRKGGLHITSPWSQVVAIHKDWEPAVTNIFREFKSTSFFIETKSGLTKYADKSNIKLKGTFTFRGNGNELLEEIKKRSGADERIGELSMFKQTQTLKSITFLLLALFFVPIIIIVVYNVIYGPGPY